MISFSYQVYVDSVHGSDLLEYDDYEDALKEARKWKKELKGDEKVIIAKITTEILNEI